MRKPLIRRLMAFSLLTCLCLHSVSLSAQAQVTINEVMSRASDRLLQWSDKGVPSLGYGSAWYHADYKDKTWLQGKGPFGFGEFTNVTAPEIATDLAQAMRDTETPSLYLRHQFKVSDKISSSTDTLILHVRFNDGFICYLNGREVLRRNAGPDHGFAYHDQLAASGTPTHREASDTPHIREEKLELGPASQWLKKGDNVIAIHALNYLDATRLHDSENDVFITHDHKSNFYFSGTLGLSSNASTPLVQEQAVWRYYAGVHEPSGSIPRSLKQPFQGVSFDDWVELRNTGAKPVSLAGWTLSDAPDKEEPWTFPDKAIIPPRSYLIIICDGSKKKEQPDTGYLHASFKISGKGETLTLKNKEGKTMDQITLPVQSAFYSYGKDKQGQNAFLSPPTPDGNNDSSKAYQSWTGTPQFSQPEGYHEKALSLELHSDTPNAVIRYTLDGSEPDIDHGLTELPISLARSASIRARAFHPDLLPSEIITQTYLINEPASLRHLPAISLTAHEERSLYLPHGVMAIKGGPFTSLKNGEPTRHDGLYWHRINNNKQNVAADLSDYNNPVQHGSSWERPAHLSIFFPDSRPVTNINMGLRIAGSDVTRSYYQFTEQNQPKTSPDRDHRLYPWNTRNFTQKPSFNFFFRSDYGASNLKLPLFPDSTVTTFDSLRLRAGKNDPDNPFIKDEFMRRVFLSTGHEGSHGILTILYVNGIFKGYYNLAERLREDFFQRHYSSKKAWDIRQAESQEEGDGVAFEEMIAFIRTHPQNILENYQAMQTRLDMVNFIDYLLVNLIGVTGNWPYSNYVVARERSPEALHRFYLWDAENAFGYRQADVTTNVFVAGNPSSWITEHAQDAPLKECICILYTLLRESPEFKLLFADRIQKHMFHDGALTEAKMLKLWEDLREQIVPLISPGAFNDPVTPWLTGINDTSRYSRSPHPERQNAPSRRQVLFDGYKDSYRDIPFVAPHLIEEGLWPKLRAPLPEPFNSLSVKDSSLSLSNPNSEGVIYYTLDGSDPRKEGGAIHGMAYTTPVKATAEAVVLKARVFSENSGWSPLMEVSLQLP